MGHTLTAGLGTGSGTQSGQGCPSHTHSSAFVVPGMHEVLRASTEPMVHTTARVHLGATYRARHLNNGVSPALRHPIFKWVQE